MKYFGWVVIFLLVSCKSKAVLNEGKAKENISAAQIIERHYQNAPNFTTLYIKSSAHYEDDKQKQNVTAEIKIKKDQVILISIRFLGITMAKAMITPDQVKYYEKINGSYFEGDYALLSKWLGTELDFQKVQNLLLGRTLENLNKEKCDAVIEDKLYKLVSNADENITKTYYFESEKYALKKEVFVQKEQERDMRIVYPTYADFTEMLLPKNIILDASQKGKKTNISIEYNAVIFNEELSFPYSVPEGYERIFIN